MNLTVNRGVFTLGGTESIPILNSVSFQSVTVEKFDSIKFIPTKLEVADPKQYTSGDGKTGDQYPESAWKSLAVVKPLIITGEDERFQPAATFEGIISGLNTAGILDKIWARPGSEITLELSSTKKIVVAVKVDLQRSSGILVIHGPFHLITDYGRFSGITELPYGTDSLTFRGRLPEHSPSIEITGQKDSLLFILTISPEETIDLFFEGGIPIEALGFIRQSEETGKVVTALVNSGEIMYPDYPHIEKVLFKTPDFVGMERLDKFSIEKITIDREKRGFQFLLNGIVGHIRTGSPEFPKDHRLTLFDTLWQNPRLMILFSIIVWVFPTTVGAYRLYKEFRE